MNKKVKFPYPIVIHDILLLFTIAFGLLFCYFCVISPTFGIDNQTLNITLTSVTLLIYLISFSAYLFIEYKYNHLNFKNIFFYIAIAIAAINIIAVACLPNKVNLPNATLDIFAFDRVYYLLSGFVFASLPVSFFYLVPRRLNNRKYVNIILIGIALFVCLSILVSFVTDFQAYKDIFSSHFSSDAALSSMFGSKSVFSRILSSGIVVVTLLHLRTKKARWLFLIIPFYFILLLAKGYLAILLITIYLLIYLITRLVLIAKKSKDNLVITVLVSGFILLIGVYFITMTSLSTEGTLYIIKDFALKALDHVKETFESRKLIWSSAFNMLLPYQYVFGFGITSFGMGLHATYTPIAEDFDKQIYHAHNMGVELIGRGGVLLLLIYLFLYVYLFYLLIKIYRKKPLVGLLGMIITAGYLFHSMFDPFFLCNDFIETTVVTVPIITEYYLLYGKEKSVRDDITKSANKLKKVKSDSKLFSLNKKCLLIEAKHISEDLKEKY